MLCNICNEREATIHLTEIAGDKVQKVDLCEECAKQKGVSDTTGFALADMLLGLGAAQELEQAAGGAGLRCPSCGFTQADFKKSGRFGCPDCYTTFAEGLESLLKTMHKGTRHVGKSPQALQQTRDISERLKLLQKKLAQSIEEENFEQAAVLRDQIKQLTARLSQMSPPTHK